MSLVGQNAALQAAALGAKRTFAYAHLSALPIRQANEAVGARLAAVTAKRESGGVATAVGESAIV